jgi:type IX secretion system PorP/SprF family membrane protein
MKRYSTILALLFCGAIALRAQQNPYLRFYTNNWQFINPAAMDRHVMKWKTRKYSIFNVQTRQQWVGFEGAPTTILVSGEYKRDISNNSWVGPKWGGTAYFDKTDAFSTMGFQGNYSYMFEMPNSDRFIHIGASFGLQFHSLNTSKITTTLVDPNDPAILNFQRRSLIDFGMGILYRAPQKFYLGISSPQMVRAYAWKQKENRGKYGNQFEQVCFVAGGFIDLSRSDSRKFDKSREVNLNELETARFVLEPSVWVRMTPQIDYINWFGDHSPISCDLNVRLYGFDRFWTGVGLGTNGNGSFEFGANFKGNSENKKGFRAGVTSSFPVLKKGFSAIPSIELFGSYFLHQK